MDLNVLILTALSIGFIHTIVGPDHYLPFIVLGKARKWTRAHTLWFAFLGGVGHVLGSVLLGLAGIALGTAISSVDSIESYRGDIASWLLICFGIAYGVWGLRIGLLSVEHEHKHEHSKQQHGHRHHHLFKHLHVHGDSKSLTPWLLFIIFILGPCEALIPLLMYPAAQGSMIGVLWVSLVFGVATILTMLAAVWIFSTGIAKINTDFMARYVHALAGFIIAISGISIKLFGL